VSIFTNPAAGAKEDAQQYVAAILGLLGTKDPLPILKETPGWCEAQTSRVSTQRLAWKEAPDKWSLIEILQHLADSEVVWGYRVRRVLAEERPQLTGFDQDLWARRLDYAGARRDQALDVFKSLRAAHVTLLRGLPDEDFSRVGIHEERGEETLRHMMRLYAGHDLAHRRQITRVLEGSKVVEAA
jgi:hypothetical protein